MNKKIYVLCPAFYKTGGTELLHQLVYGLNQKGYSSFIVYPNPTKEKNINPAFIQYTSTYISFESVKRKKNCIFVLPETFTFLLRQLPPNECIIWWESVDNYKMDFIHDWHYNGALHSIYHFIKSNLFSCVFNHKSYPASISLLRKAKANLYQSEYSNNFLKKKKIGITKFPLSDYLNETYMMKESTIDFSKKENIILFNPKKGKIMTKKIITKFRDLNFIPLINKSTEEIKGLMIKAKLYIDFGSHPGKDRMPREAAMMHCCIITNKCGSAAFYEDIPIPSKYKFNDYHLNFKLLYIRICDCLNNFASCDKEFNEYRSKICNEKMVFDENLDAFSSLMN